MRRSPVIVVAVLAALPAAAFSEARAPAPVPQFHEVAEELGIHFNPHYGGPEKAYPTEFPGSGGAWLDYDFDGRLDLFLVNALQGPADDPVGATERGLAAGPAGEGDALGHRLFRNTGSGFAEVGARAGVTDRVWGNGTAVGDVDNDGFPDLYVLAIGRNQLFRNNGDGTFSRWAAGVDDASWGTSAAFIDWDDDGALDLYVVNYIEFDAARTAKVGDGVCNYRGIEVFCGPEGLAGSVDVLYFNNGDGTFSRLEHGPVDADATYGFALVATDCNGDSLPELYVASDSTINLLYRRNAAGELEDYSLFSGAGYSAAGREQAGMGVTAGDFDQDGDMDLFVTNFTNDYNTLYRNLGNCIFEDISERVGLAFDSLPYMGWAPQFVDIDGDADLDLFVATGHIYPQLLELEGYDHRNLLHVNRLRETGVADFEERGQDAGPGMRLLHSSRSAVSGDFDNDGDTDLLITNINHGPDLLRNDGPIANPALRLTLIGRRVNRTAYGARLLVESAGIAQRLELRGSDGYLGSNDPRLLVYLPGGAPAKLTIEWMGGDVLTLAGVTPGWLVIDEERGVIARR